MKAEDFLKSKNISKPTYEGVRLVDNDMEAYRIVTLLEEYADILLNKESDVDTRQKKCTLHGVMPRFTPEEIESITFRKIGEYPYKLKHLGKLHPMTNVHGRMMIDGEYYDFINGA